nr:MAG TPA: hypothetical protein [Bacteriophage sp.]
MLALRLQLMQKLFYIAVSAQLDVFLPGNQALCHRHLLGHDRQPQDCKILLVLMLLHFAELFVDLCKVRILRRGLPALFLYRADDGIDDRRQRGRAEHGADEGNDDGLGVHVFSFLALGRLLSFYIPCLRILRETICCVLVSFGELSALHCPFSRLVNIVRARRMDKLPCRLARCPVIWLVERVPGSLPRRDIRIDRVVIRLKTSPRLSINKERFTHCVLSRRPFRVQCGTPDDLVCCFQLHILHQKLHRVCYRRIQVVFYRLLRHRLRQWNIGKHPEPICNFLPEIICRVECLHLEAIVRVDRNRPGQSRNASQACTLKPYRPICARHADIRVLYRLICNVHSDLLSHRDIANIVFVAVIGFSIECNGCVPGHLQCVRSDPGHHQFPIESYLAAGLITAYIDVNCRVRLHFYRCRRRIFRFSNCRICVLGTKIAGYIHCEVFRGRKTSSQKHSHNGLLKAKAKRRSSRLGGYAFAGWGTQNANRIDITSAGACPCPPCYFSPRHLLYAIKLMGIVRILHTFGSVYAGITRLSDLHYRREKQFICCCIDT